MSPLAISCGYWCILILTLLCLLLELIISRLCNSLINMVDSFHTLFVFLHLCLPVVHGLLANRSVTFSSSYGLARIRPFGVMVSALLLASLCASIFLDILSHFLRPHPIQRPELALAAGVMGIAFNLAIAWTSCTGRWSPEDDPSLIWNYSSGLDHKSKQSLRDVKVEPTGYSQNEAASRSPEIEPASTGSLQSSCCLFVLALVNGKCMVGPVLVVANGLAHLLMSHDCMHGWRCNLFLYLDPIFSFLTVLVLLTLALPEVKYHGYIFLQGVPAHIHLANMGHQISQLPEVVAFHDLHVWQMVGSHLVASLHVQCCDSTSYPALIAGISAVFNNVGIQQVTIQPEFTTPAQKQMQCWLACGKACSQKLCCHNPEESEKQFKKKQESEEEPKDLIFKNIYI
ncbi:zinc transporter 1 [Erpetoichthys calabaricus]|uniref:zinc transporter 1 n=1 Tax=Erpetoichthys calabaricus TaxID=27687 RepID=UPI002234AD8C|nr:zinc transporter 1 [Erpetoichthys calabaricus]